MAGLGAGVTEALVIVTPFEVVKIRLQSQVGMDKAKLKYTGPIDAAVKTIKAEVGIFTYGCAEDLCDAYIVFSLLLDKYGRTNGGAPVL